MKISARILLITFTVVVLVLVSSAVAFYSVMNRVITTQQSKSLLNSNNDFIYTLQRFSQDIEDDFILLHTNNLTVRSNLNISGSNIDFIFQLKNDSLIIKDETAFNNEVNIPEAIITFQRFKENNPLSIIKTHFTQDGRTIYYGRILTKQILNEFSKSIRAEIAVIWNNIQLFVSNEQNNQRYSFAVSEALLDLNLKNNFDIYRAELNNSDLFATYYRPQKLTSGDLNYLIFNSLYEAAELRESFKYILIIIGFSGVLVSLILVLVLTDKMRKQISGLSNATEVIKSGIFNLKVKVSGKDELAQLGLAFNTMIDELELREKAKNEYSEFITLINKNPTLAEIANASLRKIIDTAGFSVGSIYSVNEEKTVLLSSYGLKKEKSVKNEEYDLLDTVLKTGEKIEFHFKENAPSVTTGNLTIDLKYLLLLPIIYNKKVIAILELGAIEMPHEDANDYLSKIKEQLAIGLTNATAFMQLADLVDELKELNEEYQKQNLQITQQNERLIDLHNELKNKAEELEIQKEKAEEATKLKSQFLASMSHELRTPMNSILGLTELILEDLSLSDKNRERLSVVLRSGNRLMTLINDILDLSKIESGKMELRIEKVRLDNLLMEIETTINPIAANKNLEFKVTKNIKTTVVIETDKGRIAQVLINLLGNAVKFTDKGFVELRISSTNEKELIFEIIDTGIGIAPENQKIIFEEFRQVDGTTTRKYSGTGLGLAICKKIATLLEGNLTVRSEQGKGSIFTFTVPYHFVEAYETVPAPAVNKEILRQNSNNPILVIDDDPEVCYTIGQYLTSKGYEVIYANSGEQGIKIAIEHQPFVITLDIMLPDKDGWTVLRELKENPVTKDIPVILVSIIGDKNLGYGLGAYEYFVKPISSDNLLSAIARLQSLANKPIEKIVLVDDDELEFERYKNAFKNDNVKIHYIRESELAFNKINEIQPDLVILDLMMPKIDGITLTHKLKNNRDTKNIPIIISTAKDLSKEEIDSLNEIVENVTVKSKGHPLDVLRVLRDMIHMQEGNVHIEQEQLLDNFIPIEPVIKKSKVLTEINEKKSVYKGLVLIVDDDADTLFTLSEIVSECDCKTMLAKNGVECLKIMEKTTPDLILLDIMMPEMDGFQAIKRIRANPRWSAIPVYAVTAKAMVGDKAVIMRQGFDDYIPKPVNAGVLAFKIEKLFSDSPISK